jgi:hypothetical protein
MGNLVGEIKKQSDSSQEKNGCNRMWIMAKRKWGDVRRHGRTVSNISFLFKSSDLNSGIWGIQFFITEFRYLGGHTHISSS